MNYFEIQYDKLSFKSAAFLLIRVVRDALKQVPILRCCGRSLYGMGEGREIYSMVFLPVCLGNIIQSNSALTVYDKTKSSFHVLRNARGH